MKHSLSSLLRGGPTTPPPVQRELPLEAELVADGAGDVRQGVPIATGVVNGHGRSFLPRPRVSALPIPPRSTTSPTRVAVRPSAPAPREPRQVTFDTDRYGALIIPPGSTPLEPLSPDLEQRLYPWQVSPTRILGGAIRRFRGALDASDTGTGKTYVACAVAIALGFKLAVVCPKAVIPAWRRVAAEFGVDVVFILNYEKLRTGKTPFCRGRKQSWVGGSYGRGRFTQVEEFKWMLDETTLLVFDEAHRCKGANSVNSKLMVCAAIDRIHTLACSATAASTPLEMKALGVLLRLFWRGEYFQWCQNHGCTAGRYGGLDFGGDRTAQQQILFNLHRQIFPSRGARVRISDLGDVFPERIVTCDAYDLGAETADVREAYETMDDALAQLDERTRDYAINALTLMMKARQQSELLKVPMMVDMIEDLLDEGNSVAVFVNFSETIAQLAEQLPHSLEPGFIMGGQRDDERQNFIDDFQADRRRLIIANLRAGGVGISLHDLNGNFPRVGLVCPTFSVIDLVQVLGRLQRAGGRSAAVYRILYAAGTIEEDACRAVRAKLSNLSVLNDGDLRAGININFRN